MKQIGAYMVIAAGCLLSVVSQAEESRLTVQLIWRNIPRTDSSFAEYQEADLPRGGTVQWAAFTGGSEAIRILFKEGFSCITSDSSVISLRCASPYGEWNVTKIHNLPAKVEWVTQVVAIPVKGEKS